MQLPAIIANASPTLARIAAANAAPSTSTAGRGADISTAANQWGTRPAEERFWSLDDAATAAQASADRLTLRDVSPLACDIAPVNGRPALRHIKSGNSIALAPLAFEQVCRLTGSPAAYLARQDATLASACLAADWTRERGTEAAPLRLQIDSISTPAAIVRAVTTPTHDLTPNAHLLHALARVARNGDGWRVPPARVPSGYAGATRIATPADCLQNAGHPSLAVTPGTEIAPSGVYCSDRDCFALLVDDSPRGQMQEDGGLSRFVMVSNSEVGLGALEVTCGWLRSVCGNHILWGTQDVATIRAVHRGDNASRNLRRLAHTIETRGFADDRAAMSARLAAARACMLANSKDELIALLFGKKRIAPKALIADAWDVNAELSHLDGETGSAWGIYNALTRISQCQSYTADRERMDAMACKVADLVSVSTN